MGGGWGVRMHNVPCPIRMAGCMVHAAFYVCGVWPNGGTSEASPATLSRHLTQLGKQLFSNAPLTFLHAGGIWAPGRKSTPYSCTHT